MDQAAPAGAPIARLTDEELQARLRALVAREREATADVVAHLAEMGTRDACLRAGYGSLFVYCRDALGLSAADACQRIDVARALRRFPLIRTMLADGSLTLPTVRLLVSCLTQANHRAVLESARGKRKSEVEEIVVRLAPRPDAPGFVRRLPASGAGLAGSRAAPAAAASWAAIEPLAPSRYRLQVTIDGTVFDQLRLARDLLRHQVPPCADAAILERALAALLQQLARRKFASTPSPRPPGEASPRSRYVPADVRRRVFVRDLGRCAFVGEGGRRCEERAFLEFHHVEPFAAGGPTTVENIQLRCRRHNQYEARRLAGAVLPPSCASSIDTGHRGARGASP
jgi:hypothetical protein